MEWTWLFFFLNKCIVYHRCMTLILTHIWWNNIHRYRLNHFCTHTFTIADDLDYKKETRDKNAFQILTLLNYYYCVWINPHQISLRMDSSKYIIYCRLFLILFRSFLNINSRLQYSTVYIFTNAAWHILYRKVDNAGKKIYILKKF